MGSSVHCMHKPGHLGKTKCCLFLVSVRLILRWHLCNTMKCISCFSFPVIKMSYSAISLVVNMRLKGKRKMCFSWFGGELEKDAKVWRWTEFILICMWTRLHSISCKHYWEWCCFFIIWHRSGNSCVILT